MKPLLPPALGLALALAGCTTTGPATKVLTKADSGRPVTVVVGTILEIHLPSNPTTGYGWKPVEGSSPVLLLVRSSYAQNAAPGAFAGAGGTDTFRVEALQPGQQTLQWNYARPWEKGAPPAETVSFPVTVRP